MTYDTLSPQMVGAGYHPKFTAFRSSGWQIIDDTSTGASAGAFGQVGGGYFSMDIRDCRTSELYTYRLKGAYVEVGIGVDEAIKVASWSRAVARTCGKINGFLKKAKSLGVGSDLDLFSGGSMGPLYRGFDMNTPQLEYNDLPNSIWVHGYVGADAGAAGDFGLIWCLGNGSVKVDLTPSGLFGTCPAWGPYWGFSASLGIGVKMMFRTITMTSIEQIPYNAN